MYNGSHTSRSDPLMQVVTVTAQVSRCRMSLSRIVGLQAAMATAGTATCEADSDGTGWSESD